MRSAQELAPSVKAADRNYAGFPDVCAVSVGAKYKNGEREENVTAIQFFVTEKRPLEELSRPLPKFVFPRNETGDIDRSSRIYTDVIELKNLELCCAAGDVIQVVGGGPSGGVAMIFQNKTGDLGHYLLTCSHVVGNLDEAPAPAIVRGGNFDCVFDGTVVANSVARNARVDFDVALCEFTPRADFSDLIIRDELGILRSFAQPGDLEENVELMLSSPISFERPVHIRSSTSTFRDIRLADGNTVTIGNLIACRGVAARGDSGGIAFIDDRAVGMIVAKADDDWVLIHPLREAFAFAAMLVDFPLQCFAN